MPTCKREGGRQELTARGSLPGSGHPDHGVWVQALTTAHNIPLALRLVENLFIGYNDVQDDSSASLLGVGRGIGGL
jgi:hypothetical protein